MPFFYGYRTFQILDFVDLDDAVFLGGLAGGKGDARGADAADDGALIW